MRLRKLLGRMFGRGSERDGVFHTRINDKPVTADAAVIQRKLNEVCPEWAEFVSRLEKYNKPLGPLSNDPKLVEQRYHAAEIAAKELAAAVAVAFNAPPMAPDGSGFTEAERVKILGDYLRYVNRLMEKTRPLANSPAGTVSPAGAA